jgi:hypothetical protein
MKYARFIYIMMRALWRNIVRFARKFARGKRKMDDGTRVVVSGTCQYPADYDIDAR